MGKTAETVAERQKIEQAVAATGEAARRVGPMAGSITNTVTVNFVANAQLAVGGSAAMVYLPDEAEAIARAGGATYINVGTLLPVYAQTVPAVTKTLNALGRPWVLDPVAIGIGALRTELLAGMKPYKPAIIRGNASEIIALAGLWGLDGGAADSGVRGVDATDSVQAAKDAAVALARHTGGAVAVSGKTDLVTDGRVAARSHGGSPMMARVTGCGCSLGGVAAVYAAVAEPFAAALAATAAYNLAGRQAAEKAAGSGSFQMHFIDALYRLTGNAIAANPFDLEEV